MAYDKLARRHFVYYNHVIKPALVGLAGPWISGGIEFNWLNTIARRLSCPSTRPLKTTPTAASPCGWESASA